MVASQSGCDPISVNENGGDSNGLIDEMGRDPIPINPVSSGHDLVPGIINEYGQFIGEYSDFDDDLRLSKFDDDDDALEFCYDFDVTFHEKMADLERPSALNREPLSEYVDHSVSDGAMVPVNENTSSLPSIFNPEPLSERVSDGAMAPVNENTSSLEDSSENQSQIPSPVSVLKRKRSYSNAATTTMSSQFEHCQPTKESVPGGPQYRGTTISSREQSQAVQSRSEYSMESFLSDVTEESVPLQVVRTRKISDLLDLNRSNRAVKKCMHCESTETPQWRNGPMGRKTLCNACGVQYKHGRLFADYRPLRSPTFDPSKHFSLPKKVQQLRMGHTSERGLNIASKTNKVKGMSKGNNARDCDPDFTLKPKKFKEMRMGNRWGRDPNYTLKPKKLQELRMDNTYERVSNPTFKPKSAKEMRISNNYDMGQNLTDVPIRVGEMRMGNKSNLGQNLNSEPERVKEMSCSNNNTRDQDRAHNMGQKSQNHTSEPERVKVSWGDNNERDQNRAHKAKIFHNFGEKDSNWLDSDSLERDRNFESRLQQNRKVVKKCTHCASTETPQWREGPTGRKTLCNACGVQYRHGRLFPEYRPLKSPTYDPLLHSHLPKKVLKMRMRIAERCAASGNCEDKPNLSS